MYKSFFMIVAAVLCFGFGYGYGCLAYAVEGLRDPLRPAQAVSASNHVVRSGEVQSPWRLQSIFISPERRIAILNEKLVSVGDRVAGAEVMAIEANKVVLQSAGSRFAVNMHTKILKEEQKDMPR
ncbi:MAG: hypothetical protein H0W44_01465 [Gammaproteobacteria bacterium]|nr:hypothetical protein [Gammaproteobacteria bacterium]